MLILNYSFFPQLLWFPRKKNPKKKNEFKEYFQKIFPWKKVYLFFFLFSSLKALINFMYFLGIKYEIMKKIFCVCYYKNLHPDFELFLGKNLNFCLWHIFGKGNFVVFLGVFLSLIYFGKASDSCTLKKIIVCWSTANFLLSSNFFPDIIKYLLRSNFAADQQFFSW